MKLKLFVAIVLLAVGIGAAVFAVRGASDGNASATRFLTTAVARGTVTDDVAATGTVSATATYGLAFGSDPHVAGDDAAAADGASGTTWPVVSVEVKVGDAVKAGDVLAAADPSALEDQLAIADANVNAAILQRTIAEEALDDADTTDATRQAKINLYNARAQVGQQKQTRDDLAAEFAASTLVAPVDGVVTAVNIVKGLEAPAGDAIVLNVAALQVVAEVVEQDLRSVSLGQTAELSIDAIDTDVTGTVAAIAPVASTAASGGVVTYAVTVGLQDPPATIRPGMTADVTITIAEATDVLMVPSTALQGGGNGGYAVRVLDAAGDAQVRPVTVGLVTASMAEVASGLTEGELVVTGISAAQVQAVGGGALPGGGFGGGIRPGGGQGGQGTQGGQGG